MKKVLLIFVILTSSLLKISGQNCQFLCNGDFENPSFGHWTDIPDTLFPCWQTTEADSIIEVWWTGFESVPAYHGSQFVELNANAVGTLFQNFLIAPGTNVTVGFAHRGRAGVDTMSVSIGPVGGPYVTLGIYGDGNTAWGYYTVSYTIPLSLGNYYSLRFNSIYASGGPTVGNFLDDISVNINPYLNANTASTNILCYGDSSGTASVSVITGLAPYTYLWSQGGTTDSISRISAGLYTCSISDANGCTIIDSVIVAQPSAQLACNIPLDSNILCGNGNTGSVTAIPSGGTGPYSYTWSPGGATTASIGSLSAGTYSVIVKDANGCLKTDTVSIIQSPLMNCTTSGTNVICYNSNTGSATANASGGVGPYTYLWSPGGQTTATASNLSAGVYTVTVKGANGCTTMDTITIFQPANGLTCTTNITNILCHGDTAGSATVTATGGTGIYTYLWSPGGETTSAISNLSAGTYSITIGDGSGCTATATAVITQPVSAINCSIPNVNGILCNGATTGTASANVSGGTPNYTYTWSPSGATTSSISNLSAGSYSITVKDANGCLITDTITIFQSPLLTCNIPTFNNVLCAGSNTGSATASPSGGLSPYTYSWSPGGETTASISNLSAGTYTVTVSGANGCPTTAAVTISEPSLLAAGIISSTNVLCNGGTTGSAVSSSSGGSSPYTYNWTGGGTTATVSNLSAGTYTLTVTDANGCETTDMVTITQPSSLRCSIPTFSNTGCETQDTNGSATATGSGGTLPYTYSWSPGGETGATVNKLSAGTYTVTVTDANGCKGLGLVSISTQPPALFACCDKTIIQGAFVVITADSSVHYVWSPSTGLNCDTCQSVIATPTVTTTYTVTGTDSNGCVIERTITITVDILCADFTVPNVFTPNNDAIDDQLVIKAENMDMYTITIYDRWGKEMYKSSDPTQYWNGKTESAGEAPTGVYYYLINSTCKGNTYKKDGFVQLIR